MAILIKRYANRKLYNTDTSRYITLKGISKLLAEGKEVRVVDKETGEDITQVALSQILVDSQRAKEDPSDTLLTQILSRGGDALYGAIKKSVDDATDGLGEFQDRFRNLVGQSESSASSRGFPWEPRAERERRSPFAGQESETSGARDREPGGDDRRFDGDRKRASEDDGEASASGGRGAWPRFAGLPDLRELIRSVVAKELDALDLPRNRDIRALNERLARVAKALERLENARSEESDRSEDKPERTVRVETERKTGVGAESFDEP